LLYYYIFLFHVHAVELQDLKLTVTGTELLGTFVQSASSSSSSSRNF